MCLSAKSPFSTQTRNSWNPVMNVKNLTQPAVALHQAETGLGFYAKGPGAPPSPLQDSVDFAPQKKVFSGTFLGGG